ncbi:MAG: glycosyltransferase [Candidatus Eisenbacteria bacterium]|nr:glycosyltransferase [Candidatus Latescibacterota bacterium]MBD3302294.1 glycosyltransferase [Candidatus Eisenbacteria bacterium]
MDPAPAARNPARAAYLRDDRHPRPEGARPLSAPPRDGLSVLIVSYRDLRHPQMGGAEVILYEIYRRLRERGHRITFLTGAWPGSPAADEIEGMRVVRVGSTATYNLAVPGAYRKLRREERFDVMVEDLNKIPLFTPSFQKEIPVLANVPHLFGTTVFREASWPVALYVYLYERLIPASYRRCRFQVLSDSTRDDLIGRGLSAERIHVIRSGIDHELYRPPDRDGPPGPVVLYLGRLKRYKGIELAIRALPRVLEAVPSAEYWIVGEGDFRPALERMAREKGVEGRVRLFGYKDGREKLDLMAATRVLVYTSPKEGWGLSVIEANAMGIPVVASDAPGLRESVRDGETGYLVPHGDVDALAGRLTELLSDDRLWGRMGRAGIEWASRFRWDRMADETEELLRRVVREGRGEDGT